MEEVCNEPFAKESKKAKKSNKFENVVAIQEKQEEEHAPFQFVLIEGQIFHSYLKNNGPKRITSKVFNHEQIETIESALQGLEFKMNQLPALESTLNLQLAQILSFNITTGKLCMVLTFGNTNNDYSEKTNWLVPANDVENNQETFIHINYDYTILDGYAIVYKGKYIIQQIFALSNCKKMTSAIQEKTYSDCTVITKQ